MTRKTFACALPFAAALPLLAAYAGGWAVITVDTLPDYAVAGRPTNLTFAVRQHGMHLLGSLEPRVEAESGQLRVEARAVPTNREGYYTAALRLPATGDWTITLRSGFRTSDIRLMPIPAVASGAQNVAAISDAERGRKLFVAKGCLTCHVHAQVPGSGQIAVGPELTVVRFAPDYLREFLANPQLKTPAVAGRVMPNLNLKQNEIASLIAFLSAGNSTSRVSAKN